jgi:hypothetical protein
MSKLNGHCRWSCELTDTFGGEANYAWVRRGTTLVPDSASRRTIVRRVKAELGLTGTRCHTHDHGDMIELRPVRFNTVAFATIEY